MGPTDDMTHGRRRRPLGVGADEVNVDSFPPAGNRRVQKAQLRPRPADHLPYEALRGEREEVRQTRRP